MIKKKVNKVKQKQLSLLLFNNNIYCKPVLCCAILLFLFI
jgi:hypothetical protein